MQHSNIQKRHFTLVELMVAMGVLVIMMGFLFQFTIGAQRIWNASSRQTTSFSTAQVVMDVLNDDLQNMRYSNDAYETMPFYVHKDGDDLTMCFFTDCPSSPGPCWVSDILQAGTYTVLYYYDSASHKLHRCMLDREKIDYIGGSRPINPGFNWRLYGINIPADGETDPFETFKQRVSLTSPSDIFKKLDILAENVTKFDIGVFFGNEDDEALEANKSFNPSAPSSTPSKYYAKKKPVSVRISFELETDKNAKPGEETKYSFSKVLFL